MAGGARGTKFHLYNRQSIIGLATGNAPGAPDQNKKTADYDLVHELVGKTHVGNEWLVASSRMPSFATVKTFNDESLQQEGHRQGASSLNRW
jgi:hypothetical protein